MFEVQSIGPVSQPQWTEEAEERQRLGPDQSILSFPGYTPHSSSSSSSSLTSTKPISPGRDGGAVIQVIRATTVMATDHWGNCCSNKLCSMLSAISSTISFINGKWCHGSDYTPVASDLNMCLHVSRENKSISFKHATCSVWGNKQSALFVPYNKQCGCECVGGGQGTKPHSTIRCVWNPYDHLISSAPNKDYIIRTAHTPKIVHFSFKWVALFSQLQSLMMQQVFPIVCYSCCAWLFMNINMIVETDNCNFS